MKIAYVGNFSQAHCTEVHLAKTLEDLGHEVIRFQENELTPDWVLDRPDGVDMVLYTRTWGDKVTLLDLEQLRKLHIPTVSYHLDLYVGLARKYLHEGKTLDEVLQTDPFWRTDFVFTPDGDPESAEVFKRNGVNHYYMKPGVFKPECYMAQPNGNPLPDGSFDRPIDVLFVGGGDYPGSPNGYGHPEWPYRDKLIQWLRDTYGDRFVKHGHPQQTIRNDELNQLYANSKVVIGDSVCLGFNHKNYWSDRVYETLGRGGFLIHPYIEGMEDEFTHAEHLAYYTYNDFGELKMLIDHYLEHDEDRERIRRAGHEFVKNHATYNDRLSAMLNIVIGRPNLDREAISSLEEKIPPSDPMLQGNLAMNEAAFAMDTADGEDTEVGYYRDAEGVRAYIMGKTRINLGAGSEPTEGWVNVDWTEGPGIDVIQNLLLFPWPFADNEAEEIKAIDVLEHMPNYTPDNKATALEFVEECHRILKPGGTLTIQVPHWRSPNCWIDPTHVRGFGEKSMDYFDPDKDFGQWYGYYTRGKFHVTAEVSTMPDGTTPSNVTFRMVKR
jgi:SAM-dependent methyltransferase